MILPVSIGALGAPQAAFETPITLSGSKPVSAAIASRATDSREFGTSVKFTVGSLAGRLSGESNFKRKEGYFGGRGLRRAR
jgi:hypothetical protein